MRGEWKELLETLNWQWVCWRWRCNTGKPQHGHTRCMCCHHRGSASMELVSYKMEPSEAAALACVHHWAAIAMDRPRVVPMPSIEKEWRRERNRRKMSERETSDEIERWVELEKGNYGASLEIAEEEVKREIEQSREKGREEERGLLSLLLIGPPWPSHLSFFFFKWMHKDHFTLH